MDRYGPIGGEGLVFVHGNMATRRMFCSLVREVLAIRPNSRIFCIDVSFHDSLHYTLTHACDRCLGMEAEWKRSSP